jgi:hypothetical protein
MVSVGTYCIVFIISVLILFSCSDNKSPTQEVEIQSALKKLQNKNYSDAWLVIAAGFNGRFIQFYSYSNEVYFDFPLYSEIKNKYKDERFEGRIDSTSNNTFFTKYLTNSQLSSLKKLLDDYNLDYEEMRLGFIEPTFANQTDTTGWNTSIRGVFTIDIAQSKKFIDEYFTEVYGYKTDSITYSFEEN